MALQNRFMCLAIFVSVLSFSNMAYAVDWNWETLKSQEYKYRIVAEDGTTHHYKATYQAKSAFYKYQTGHSSKPLEGQLTDTRTCHWGFDRELVRIGETLPADGIQRTGPWVEGVRRRVLFTPDLFVSDQLRTEYQLLLGKDWLGITGWKEGDTPWTKIGKVMTAVLTAEFITHPLNCGEADSTIASQYATVKDRLKASFPLTNINYYIHAFELSNNWFYFNDKGEKIHAVFVYPEHKDDNYYVPIVKQELKGAFAATAHLSPGELPDADLEKYLAKLDESDWQEQFYREFMIEKAELYIKGDQTYSEQVAASMNVLREAVSDQCVLRNMIGQVVSISVVEKADDPKDLKFTSHKFNVDDAIDACAQGCYADFDPTMSPIEIEKQMYFAFISVANDLTGKVAFKKLPLIRKAMYVAPEEKKDQLRAAIDADPLSGGRKAVWRIATSNSNKKYRECLESKVLQFDNQGAAPWVGDGSPMVPVPHQ